MKPLTRTFGVWTGVSIVAGSVIGSGIFMKPATMAAQLGSPELLIVVWVGAGVITLFGALGNAEIAAMLPETGGQYVFFKKMYGNFFAFLYGWAAFAVFNTAGVASIAYVMSTYLEYFFSFPRFSDEVEQSLAISIPFIGYIYPLQNAGVKSMTVLVVWVLTLISYRSTRVGGNVLVLFTMLKIAAIVMIVLAIFFSDNGQIKNFVTNDANIWPQGWALAGAVMAAAAGAFWAFDGWNNIGFVAGEIRNPQRVIPRSLFLGICICILLYVMVNLAFLYVMPVSIMATSELVASDAARLVFGSAGGACIALLVILSTLGSTHANILSTTRVTFAVSNSGHFFRIFGVAHPRFDTPGNALVLHGFWASILVISGSFDMLTDMLIFVSWFFYGMSALGIFVLRHKMKDVHRPYKVWGYPVVPLVFISFTGFFLCMTLYTDITNYVSGQSQFINSIMGIALTAIGIPLYLYFHIKKSSK